jgi:hypothetical protein
MQSKEIDVRVELEEGTVRPLRREYEQFTLKKDIEVLKDYYKDLWRMYIFVSPDVYEDDAKCLAIIEAFVKKYQIPREDALRKARKPNLARPPRVGEIARSTEERKRTSEAVLTKTTIDYAARTAFSAGAVVSFHGSNSSMRLIGWSAMSVRT